MNIGEFIYRKRIENKITTHSFAKELGISVSDVYQLETNSLVENYSTKIREIANLLNLTHDERRYLRSLRFNPSNTDIFFNKFSGQIDYNDYIDMVEDFSLTQRDYNDFLYSIDTKIRNSVVAMWYVVFKNYDFF